MLLLAQLLSAVHDTLSGGSILHSTEESTEAFDSLISSPFSESPSKGKTNSGKENRKKSRKRVKGDKIKGRSKNSGEAVTMTERDLIENLTKVNLARSQNSSLKRRITG